MSQKGELDAFYSSVPVSEWRKILGQDLHYHFGYFSGSEDLETGLRQTVRNFYPHVPQGSRVLDMGCGWGGPARLLSEERGCRVEGVTVSAAQAAYCQELGLRVWHADLEQAEGPLQGRYDVVFSLEMISHIRDKVGVLRRLRGCGDRLVLSESCAADGFAGELSTFGGSMVLSRVSELLDVVERAGWRVRATRDRRFRSLRTIALWKQNLEREYGDQEPPGQLAVLRSLVESALRSPIQWAQSFPLIDLVAE